MKVKNYYDKQLKSGESIATGLLGSLLIEGGQPESKPCRRRKALTEGYSDGDHQAMANFGLHSFMDKSLRANPAEGEKLVEQAIAAGSRSAAAEFGIHKYQNEKPEQAAKNFS